MNFNAYFVVVIDAKLCNFEIFASTVRCNDYFRRRVIFHVPVQT